MHRLHWFINIDRNGKVSNITASALWQPLARLSVDARVLPTLSKGLPVTNCQDKASLSRRGPGLCTNVETLQENLHA